MITRWRETLHDDQAGMTLVELVVVISIMGILGAMLSTWFITTQRTTTAYTNRISDLSSARLAMDRMTRDLRMAISPSNGITAIDPSSTGNTVTAYVNQATGAPMKVTYSLIANGDGTVRLVRAYTPATGSTPPFTWPSAQTRTQVLAQRLSQGTQLIFAYYDQGGAADPPCGPGVPPPCASPMSTSPTLAYPGSVGAIEIVLRAQSGIAAPPVELRTRVRTVNVGLTAIV